MANLDIAERRLPQDGRIELNVGGNPVDLRVSVLPTMFGESVVMRVLDRTVVSLDLEQDRHGPDDARPVPRAHPQAQRHRPGHRADRLGQDDHALLGAQRAERRSTDKIITTEDPVEYDIDGIIQVPINPEIGVTFAACLRAILRQDPDMILVGEIRDLETAEIAVQASLTGHIVFSTLHTNDAPSADHPAARHGRATVPDHRHGRRRAGPAAGAARSASTAGPSSRPARRSAHGAGADARAGAAARSSTTARAATSATTPATRAAWASSSCWS